MLLLLIKTIHVLGAMVFLGTGAGSAWYKMRASRTDDARVTAWCDVEIVRADWIFTVPAGVTMPLTGALLVHLNGMSWTTPWILIGLLGYAIAGVFWLPAAWLQIRMRELSTRAAAAGEPLPAAYARAQRAWTLLGVPSFLAAIVTIWVMVAKWAAW